MSICNIPTCSFSDAVIKFDQNQSTQCRTQFRVRSVRVTVPSVDRLILELCLCVSVLVLKGSEGQEGQYGLWKGGIVQTLGKEPPVGIKKGLD